MVDVIQQIYFDDITLLITHYNRSSSLKRLLDRLAELNIKFGEIIVSDDCSDNSHLEKLLIWKDEYPFTLILAEKNGGLGNNLNKGADQVKTPYTLYIQEDFIPQNIFKEILPRAYKIINENIDIDLIRFYAYNPYPYLKYYDDDFSEMIYKPWFTHTGKIHMYSDHPHLRRSTFFQKFGRYRENIKSDKTEYLMCVSFIQQKGRALFYNQYKSLFLQENTQDEPSTVVRSNWRHSHNVWVKMMRILYRRVKHNFDIHIGKKLHTYS